LLGPSKLGTAMDFYAVVVDRLTDGSRDYLIQLLRKARGKIEGGKEGRKIEDGNR
jgi:hypothetical protein